MLNSDYSDRHPDSAKGWRQHPALKLLLLLAKWDRDRECFLEHLSPQRTAPI